MAWEQNRDRPSKEATVEQAVAPRGVLRAAGFSVDVLD
jgi:hypothetical protein